MDETAHAPQRTPLHLWIVGVLSALWNAIGAIDYVMTRFHNDAYFVAAMPGQDVARFYAYVASMPLVQSIGWGLGVWGAIAGSLLLLMRSRHAVPAFLASLVGAVVSFAYQFTSHKPPAGMDSPLLTLVILAIGLGLLLYAQRMWARGVLR